MTHSPERPLAPRPLRLAAFLLDALLAVLTAVGLRLLIQLGVLPAWGSWAVFDQGARIDPQLIALSLILLAMRDVFWRSSPAKWLLSLTLVRSNGQGLSFLQRLTRAPFSLLPLGLLGRAAQDSLPWRVVSYSPGRTGLLTRTAVTAFAATFSLLWAIETIRPSIARDDAMEMAEKLTTQDPLLQRELGGPLVVEIGEITRRAHQFDRGHSATFQLTIQGSRGRQAMIVLARKVDGTWQLDELRDIDITMTDPSERVAERSGTAAVVAPE